MKSQLRTVDDHGVIYTALMFVCPGCQEFNSGLHMLTVNSPHHQPSWTWDNNLEIPTLSPSILTDKDGPRRCHSFLKQGVFEFLSDCTHSLAGQKVPIPDLHDWAVKQ